MSKPNSNAHSRAVKIACALALITGIAWLWPSAARAGRQDLPEGKGVELARDKCLLCHEADLIAAQRLSKPGWTREVEKMMRWGAKATDAEKAILIDYFSAHFGPRKASATVATANVERGKQIFDAKCLLCHEVDLVEQQRLGKPGWTREVDKMVRWGAKVSDAEKDALVDYLLRNHGPRPLGATR